MADLWNLVVGTSEERINVSLLITKTMVIGFQIYFNPTTAEKEIV